MNICFERHDNIISNYFYSMKKKQVAKMNEVIMSKKNKSLVVKASEGDAFWQPGTIKGNCIAIKVSPWNIPLTGHTVFLHELPKNGTVGEHAHEKEEEIFICLEGKGTITIDDKDFLFRQHDVAYIAPYSKHKIRATSDSPLKYMVIISPTGLEERLKLMGIERKSLNEAPPEPFDSNIGRQDTHSFIKI